MRPSFTALIRRTEPLSAEREPVVEDSRLADREFMSTLAKGLKVLASFGEGRPTLTLSEAAALVGFQRVYTPRLSRAMPLAVPALAFAIGPATGQSHVAAELARMCHGWLVQPCRLATGARLDKPTVAQMTCRRSPCNCPGRARRAYLPASILAPSVARELSRSTCGSCAHHMIPRRMRIRASGSSSVQV